MGRHTGFAALGRVEMLRLRFWAGRLLRLPSVALGALLTLWAGTSAFGQGLHAAAAAGAWGALPLACVFAALAACLVLAQARYRAALLAGPFYPLLAGEAVLDRWIACRGAAALTPLAGMAILAGSLQSGRATLLAAFCACAGGAIGLGAGIALAPWRRVRVAQPRLAARALPVRVQHPALTIARARLRRRWLGRRAGAWLIPLLGFGLAASFLATRNAPETSAGAVLFAITGAGLLTLMFSPDLHLLLLLRTARVGTGRLLAWFVAAPVAIGMVWTVVVSAIAAPMASATVVAASTACLFTAAWLVVLLLHGFTKAPDHAVFAARAELVLLALLCGLFPHAVPILVPGWIIVRLVMLLLAARRGRFLA